jgi:hypothetical protein
VNTATPNELYFTNDAGTDFNIGTAAAVTALRNACADELVTVGGTTTELCAEANLTFDGSTLTITGGISVPTANGIDYDVSGDADTDIATIGVGGAPRLLWDESQDAFGMTHSLKVGAAGITNGFMTLGVSIKQPACTNTEILAFKSSDVGHAITDSVDACTWGTFQKAQGSSGGMRIRGIKSAAGVAGQAIILQGMLGEAADTSDATSSTGVIALSSNVICGNCTKNVVDAGNLIVIQNAATTRFLIKGDGDVHATSVSSGCGDLNATALDDWEDAKLLRAFTLTSNPNAKGLIKSTWCDFVNYNEEDLKNAGILGKCGVKGGLFNWSQLTRAQTGAIWQLYTRVEQLSIEVNELKQLEAPNA